MVIIKNNQISVLFEMDWSKELKQKSPLGINGLRVSTVFYLITALCT